MPDEFPLDRLAGKASNDPFFFGHWLRLYATGQALTNAALAKWLGCSVEVLQKVRLCRKPADREQAVLIAEKFGVPVERICEVMGW